MDTKKDRKVIFGIILKYIQMLRKSRVRFSEVYFFGSYLKGTYNPDSDIDLAIVLDKKDIDRFDERLKLMRLRWNVDLRIEPHPFTREDFDDTNPFVREIITTGVKIY